MLFIKEYELLGSLFIDDVMLKLVQLAEREIKVQASSSPSNEQFSTEKLDKIQFTPEQGFFLIIDLSITFILFKKLF